MDTWGCVDPELPHEVVDGALAAREDVEDRRRRGSATALNTSAVVAARAMPASYAFIGICQDARVLSRWYVLLVFALLVLILIVGFIGC